LECRAAHVGELGDQLVDLMIRAIIQKGIACEAGVSAFDGRDLPACSRFNFLPLHGRHRLKTSV
jgi:hypothetical protein